MRTHVNLKAAALSKVIGLTVLAIAIGCFGYRWHRAVSAQSPTDGVNRERPEAVAHGKILFTRFVTGDTCPIVGGVRTPYIPKVFIVDSNSAGSETCLGMCTDASDSRDGQDAAWSPDRSTIAFTRLGEIWLMNADGSNQRRIASGGVTGGNATFSSDGTKIAFTKICASCWIGRPQVIQWT